MIQSMTGYGKAVIEIASKKITVEIKSLNSKQLDLSVRMPSIYKEQELSLRSLLSKELSRGKIDLSIYIENLDNTTCNKINQSVIGAYHEQIKEIAKELNIPEPADWFSVLLRMPEVLKHELPKVDEQEWLAIMKGVNEAIVELKKFRVQEGQMLNDLFVHNIDEISRLLNEIVKYETPRIDRIREKFDDVLDKISNIDYDRNRLEQEMIYHIEKLDINEEKSRLKNHLKYFITTINDEEAQGRKLNFITQEIGREINTMGSKSNDAEMQKIVVQMKDCNEQIKEQVLNVL